MSGVSVSRVFVSVVSNGVDGLAALLHDSVETIVSIRSVVNLTQSSVSFHKTADKKKIKKK